MEATGIIFKILRIANDYTTNQVATYVGVSHTYISLIESGKRGVTEQIFKKLTVLYNLSGAKIKDLVLYYESVDFDEKKKYQATLAKAIEIILNQSDDKSIKASRVYKILKIAREANFMTQQTVSAISGVSMIYISELENGKKESISRQYLEKLSSAYNLRTQQVFEVEEYYESLDCDENRKLRLIFIKVLEMINNNLNT